MAFSHAAYYESELETPAARRERLILEHLPQVRFLAARIHERLPSTFSLDDLVSAGILGLIAAVDNYNPAQQVKLNTYANYRINGAILDSLRGADGTTQLQRQQRRMIQNAIQKLESELQRTPGEEEISERLGVGLERYREMLQSCSVYTIGSLDAALPNTDDITFVYCLADRSENQPTQMFEREELRSILADGIKRMPSTERNVLSLYYVEELTLREIGEIMGLHSSRISQLKTQALLRLRTLLEKRGVSKKEKVHK